MTSKEYREEVLSTDILIIGGGLAGVVAAAKAGEEGVEVLVAEKGVTGWAGEVPCTAGYSMVIPEDFSIDNFVKWVVENGGYLSNQDWTYAFGTDSYETAIKLAEWGLPFYKENDSVKIVPNLRYYATVTYYPSTFMLSLRKVAATRGVKFLNKVFVTDLIVQNGEVTGAVGIGLVDGKYYAINAKAVIIATGGVRSKRGRGFTWCNGEGPSMAYRAGAEIMNAEFLNHYIPFSKEWTATTRLPIYYFYVNKKAEKVVLKHFPELAAEMRDGKPMEDQVKIVEAVGKEIMAGNGPIRIDTSTATPEELVIVRGKTWDNPALRKHKILPDSWELPKIKAGIDIEREKMELEPVYLGGQGTIRVDLECRTSLNRLWAAGDSCAVGSSWAGARTTGTYPSVGMSFGMVSGYRAGVSASIFAKHNSKPVMDMSQVEMKKNRRYAPLSRGNGPSYHELIYGIHEVTMPMKYNFFRRGDRLREALNKLESVQEKLGEASATDSHTLVKLLETESLAVCAEMTFKAALMRTESRISHKREDFVDSDDRNWLKWIIIQMRNDKMEFRKEPVPLEKYKFRPKQ